MAPSNFLSALALTIGLSACMSAPSLELPNTHPANPKAVEGLVDAPTGLASYRTAEDFAASATTEPAASGSMGNMPGMDHGNMSNMPGMDHGNMPNMPGMDHGNMPGMQHQGMPAGGKTP